MRNFIAAVIIDGEIEEAFDGKTAVEAATEAVHYMITKRPAKKIKVVVHNEETEEVVESFEMIDNN
jgi:uncharacterized protein (DUF111 family)